MAFELEDVVAAFESAQVGDGQANLAAFLPPSSHPHFATILAELIRVDLEYGWQRGRPKPIADYRQQFSHLTADTRIWPQIAFEEYRLRRQAGHNASVEEYRAFYGSAVDDWPQLGDSADDDHGTTRILSAGSQAKAVHPLEADRKNRENGAAWGSGADNEENSDPLTELRRSEPKIADCLARVLGSMPQAGGDFLDFHLVAELGRGAFGRVFLARQKDLASRLVALKISTDLFGESQTLAQLQHTNIVPIYSLHHDDPFQAVCMPYLGSTTLAHVLERFPHSLPASGKDIVSTLNHRKKSTLPCDMESAPECASAEARRREERSRASALPRSAPEPSGPLPDGETPAGQTGLKKLEEMPYVQAVLWLGARLADGLAHAHEHGIIHRDLKPANILLADDGQPLLLDFNLSRNSKLRSSAQGAQIGGTLLYMAPEHLRAFRDNTSRPVDARCDIYSLGLILFELLSGGSAFPRHAGSVRKIFPAMLADRDGPPPVLRARNKAVSPAVESIIRHCLEPDPGKRYQSARDLQEDLERQLDNRPLKFASEPSLRERTRKWMQRHPRLSSSTSVALLSLVLISTLVACVVMRGHSLARYHALDQRQQFQEEMRNAQFLLYGRNADKGKLDQGIEQCREALDRYQVLQNPDWEKLPHIRNLPAAEREQLRKDIGEMLFLASRGTLLRASYGSGAPRHTDVTLAMSLGQAAERCYEPDTVPRAIWQQQGKVLSAQGKLREAANLFEKADNTPLRTARDCYLVAHLHAIDGNFRAALRYLKKAVHKDPQSFSAWFVRGNCHHVLGQYTDAAACYSTCIALRPEFHWSWFNRGLAHYQLAHFQAAAHDLQRDHFQAAADDFDQAIALAPDLAEAYLNRGLAYEGCRRFKESVADLTRALELGSPRTQVYFLRAAVREKDGDRKGASRDRQEGLRLEPADEQSWIARGLARLPKAPKLALADFQQALKLNPRSFPALQNTAHVLADHLNDDRAAVNVLDKAVALCPDSAMAKAGRGVSLARLGKRKQALADGEAALLLDTRPPNLYQVACIYALTSRDYPQDQLRALQLLSYGLKGGFGLDLVDSDSDLDPLRKTPQFSRIVAAAKALQTR